jgi:chemotaxis signal transduction protein
METHDRYELLTRMARLERELLFVRRKLKERQPPVALPCGSFQAVRFQISVAEYAIPTAMVRQIVRYAPQRKVSIALLDLSERLGLGPTNVYDEAALMIVSVHGCAIGLVIERVSDTIALTADELHVPCETLLPDAYVAGIGTHDGRLVQVLDLERLVLESELQLTP